MELKTYNTFLTEICDYFDELITPRSIARSNTNIIYLIFKGVAKGLEVINNVCVALSSKFNPENCSEEDLISVASLVGTERRKGSASGLKITVLNSSDADITLIAGTYTYQLDEETSFEFEILSDVTLAPEAYVSYIAMSNSIGSYTVTAQPNIAVTSDVPIPSGAVFSCHDNAGLLGIPPESILDFRKRILNVYDRQNGIIELEEYLKNLPYIFDCLVRYNPTNEDIVLEDNIVVPPMTCAIFFSGEAKNEIAEMVCDHIICPTVKVEGESVAVRYENNVFANGYHEVNLIPFKYLDYSVELIYQTNGEYVDIPTVQADLQKKLISLMNTEQHIAVIKEDDIYKAIESSGVSGINVLAINLKTGDTAVDYLSVPVSRIARLTTVDFVEG